MPVIAYDPLHMAREEAFLHGLPPVAHKAAYHLIRALREAEDHRLEDDELKLATRFHMPLNQVRQARRWLLARFRLEDGLWSCPLVDEMTALIEQKRRAGSIGGRNRARNGRRSRAAPDAGAVLRTPEKLFEISGQVQAPGQGNGAPESGPNHAPTKTPINSTGEVKLTHESQESGITDSPTPSLPSESKCTDVPTAPDGDARGARVKDARREEGEEGALDHWRNLLGEVPTEPTKRAPKPGTRAVTARAVPPRSKLPRTAAGGYLYPAEFLAFDRGWPAHQNDHQPQRYDAYRGARLDGASHADMLALAEQYRATDPAREGGERRRFRKHLRTVVEAGGHIREEARQLSLPPGLRVIEGGASGSTAPESAAVAVEGPGAWPRIAATVRAEITPPVWERWFAGARCLGVVGGVLVIEARDDHARGWIRQNYGPYLSRAARRFEPAARFVEIRAAAAVAATGVCEAAVRAGRGTA